jgi:hypothetical protein
MKTVTLLGRLSSCATYGGIIVVWARGLFTLPASLLNNLHVEIPTVHVYPHRSSSCRRMCSAKCDAKCKRNFSASSLRSSVLSSILSEEVGYAWPANLLALKLNPWVGSCLDRWKKLSPKFKESRPILYWTISVTSRNICSESASWI